MSKLFQKQLIIPLLFLLIISLPLFDMLFKVDPFPHLYENRPMSQRPVLKPILSSIQAFPRNFTAFFNDHFGFRNTLIRANYFLRVRLLGTSPSKEVVLGKNGWLFFAGEGERDDYRGITHYDQQLLEKWAATLEIKRKFLADRGIRYLYVVAPNKSSVYGENLPECLNQVRGKTGLDDFVEYLKLHTSVSIVDLRPALIAAKVDKRVYLMADTHWNNYGAFIAYREMMKDVSGWFPGIKAMELKEFKLSDTVGNGGDLACMVGGSEFQKEHYVQLTPVTKSRASSLVGINDITKITQDVWVNDPSLPRAVVFRDSFFSTVAPFLAEHFRFSRYYWKPWDSGVAMDELIASVQPDIVIEEIVERTIKTKQANFIDNPPAYVVAESFAHGAKQWGLEDLIRQGTIGTNKELISKASGNKLVLTATGADPQLILPVLQEPFQKSMILKIVIKSKIDTTLQLFYKSSPSENYSEGRSVRRQIVVGNNVVYIPFIDKTISQLRLDPADKPGEFLLQQFELRSISQ